MAARLPPSIMFPPPAAKASPWIQMSLWGRGDAPDGCHQCPSQRPSASHWGGNVPLQRQKVPYVLMSVALPLVPNVGNEVSASSWSHQKNSPLHIKFVFAKSLSTSPSSEMLRNQQKSCVQVPRLLRTSWGLRPLRILLGLISR